MWRPMPQRRPRREFPTRATPEMVTDSKKRRKIIISNFSIHMAMRFESITSLV